MDDDNLYESVHNYTKFKLVEMLINRLNDGRTKVDDMNSIAVSYTHLTLPTILRV